MAGILVLMIAAQVAAAVGTVLLLGRWTRGRWVPALFVAGTVLPWVAVFAAGVALLVFLPIHDWFVAADAFGAALTASLFAIPLNLLAAIGAWGNRREHWAALRRTAGG